MTGKFIEKVLYLFDLLRIIVGEILGFFSSFWLKNSNIKNLFKLENKKTEKKLLIVSLTNTKLNINFESLTAKYFNDQGYKIYFLTNLSERRGVRTFKKIGGNIIYYYCVYWRIALRFLFKNLPVIKSVEELKDFKYKGINIGIWVCGSMSRKLKEGQIEFNDKKVRNLARKYLWMSIICLETAREIIKKIKPDLILSNEKGYIVNGTMFDAALEKEIDFIQWCGCHEPNTLVFKRYDRENKRNHPFSISDSTWKRYLNMPWKEEWGRMIYDAFEKGYLGKNWFKYKTLSSDFRMFSKEEFIEKYDLDPDKKIAVLFSHIMWDANLFYGDDIFERGFGEWLVESIKTMTKNNNINWLVKIHPANKLKHELEGIKGEYREITAIKKTFGKIPDNIKIVYPEDDINPYCLFKIIDYGITVRGTIGMELPCFGVPVLTAGTGRYSDRGFTIDSNNKEEYLNKLSHLEDIPRLDEEKKRLALVHAYVLFKLRPLKFTSYKEVYEVRDRDIEINISDAQDFKKLVNWAINSKEKDFLTN